MTPLNELSNAHVYLFSYYESINKLKILFVLINSVQKMGKRKFNAKGRQVVDTIIDDTATKQVSESN